MILQCLENEFSGSAEKFILNFILNSCGFFFEWTNSPDSSSICINYGTENISGYKSQLLLSRQYNLATLHYENLKWVDIDIAGKTIPVLQSGKEMEKSTIPFDIVATIYFHLACIEEFNYNHPDDVDKNMNKRLLYNYNKFHTPVVDIIIRWFANKVQKFASENGQRLITKSLYPKNEDFGIAITHDVDFINALHPLKLFVYKLFRFFHLISKDKFSKIIALNNSKWPFENLIKLYSEKNWKVTFNFIARYMEGLHFRYRIKSKKVNNLIVNLKNGGHEIGFHPSKYAFENDHRYKKESATLKRVTQCPVYGMRHHYLRTLFPTVWRVVENTSLQYDSSMAFRRHSGFRAGTSLPFNGYDHKNQKILNCTEFPTLFFEGSLPVVDEQKSILIIEDLFKSVKLNNGLLTLLWHTNNMETPEPNKNIWSGVVKIIDQSNAHITSLKNHLDWQNFRNSIKIVSVNKKDQTTELIINKPEGFSGFSLITSHDNFSIENADWEKINSSILIKSKSTEEKITILIPN